MAPHHCIHRTREARGGRECEGRPGRGARREPIGTGTRPPGSPTARAAGARGAALHCASRGAPAAPGRREEHAPEEHPQGTSRSAPRTSVDTSPPQPQSSPRQASSPSRAMKAVIPSAATGSAHHQPKAALSPTPESVTMESQKHAVVWKASASSARLPSLCAAAALGAREPLHRHDRHGREADADGARARRLPRPQGRRRLDGHVGREQEQRGTDEPVCARVEPLDLARGRPRAAPRAAARRARRRMRSRRSCRSPNPRRATLPASTAAVTATTPSTTFQPTVRYSRRSAWRTPSSRSAVTSMVAKVRNLDPRRQGQFGVRHFR